MVSSKVENQSLPQESHPTQSLAVIQQRAGRGSTAQEGTATMSRGGIDEISSQDLVSSFPKTASLDAEKAKAPVVQEDPSISRASSSGSKQLTGRSAPGSGKNSVTSRSSTATTQGETSSQHEGVSLAFLRSFVDSRRNELEGLSTADVCEKFIKPATQADNCSYADILRKKDTSSVGQATIFISHAWMYNFLMLVDIIFDWCTIHKTAQDQNFLWFDIFVVNQHSGMIDFTHWAEKFPRTLSRMKKALIVLMPWEKSCWFQRAWCLFELWAVMHSKVKPTFLLGQEDEAKFRKFLASGGKFENFVGTIDISKAESTKDWDQTQIRTCVQATVGSSTFNQRITGAFREWCIVLANDELGKIDLNAGLISELQINLADMQEAAGHYDVALAMLTKRLKAQLSKLGSTHDQVGDTKHRIGRLHWRQSKYPDASKMLSEALAIKRRVQGPANASVAEILEREGCVLRDQGKYADALAKYTESLEIMRRLRGGTDTLVGELLRCVGELKTELGRHSDALADLNRALEIQKEASGEESPEAAKVIWSLGHVYEHMEKTYDAMKEYEEALRLQRAALGERHPDVATTLVSLGDAMLAQFKPEDALACFDKALRTRRATLGAGHPALAEALDGLARAQLQLGRHEAAMATYQESLRVSRAAVGDAHPAVGATMRGIGLVHDAQGEHSLALSSFRTALQIQTAALGERHPAVAQTRYHMGDLLTRMKRPKEAKEELKNSYAVFKKVYGPRHSRTQETFRKVSTVEVNNGPSSFCVVS